MQTTIAGIGILGVAIFIAYSSRDNTDETAAQTFGTLAVILVLALVGLSLVRKGEAERVRNKGRNTKGPYKHPVPKGLPPIPGHGPAKKSAELSEGTQKALVALVLLLVLGGGGFALKSLVFRSSLTRLAEAESPNSPDQAEESLEPLLEKLAERFGQPSDEVGDILWSNWEAHQKNLTGYDLRPSGYAREIMAAAPKSAELEKVAGSLGKEKAAARMARLHQPKPAPGSYAQEAEFQKALDQLHEKTGMSRKPIAAALIKRWRVIFEKKKKNRNYNLLWFTKLVNSKTRKGTKEADWLKRVSKWSV